MNCYQHTQSVYSKGTDTDENSGSLKITAPHAAADMKMTTKDIQLLFNV